MRLAEVWMDDYKRLYYMHRHDLIVKKMIMGRYLINRRYSSRAKITETSKNVAPFVLVCNVIHSNGTLRMSFQRNSFSMKMSMPSEKYSLIHSWIEQNVLFFLLFRVGEKPIDKPMLGHSWQRREEQYTTRCLPLSKRCLGQSISIFVQR